MGKGESISQGMEYIFGILRESHTYVRDRNVNYLRFHPSSPVIYMRIQQNAAVSLWYRYESRCSPSRKSTCTNFCIVFWILRGQLKRSSYMNFIGYKSILHNPILKLHLFVSKREQHCHHFHKLIWLTKRLFYRGLLSIFMLLLNNNSSRS